MRNKLIQTLVKEWRKAENYFLETEDDSQKWKVYDKQNKANLSLKETAELNECLQATGF
jgi:hypothetical protein